MAQELFERERELAALAAVVDSAVAGTGGHLLVEGPAGIGKTALLRAALEHAETRSVQTLFARGGELEHDLGHGVLRQLFEPVLAGLDPAQSARLLSGAAAFAAPALGLALPTRTPAAPIASSAVALHGLYWLTVNLSAHGALLVVVDDAHWADAASVRFLAYLARRLDGLPIALLTATRDGQPGEWSPAQAELRTSPNAVVVRPPTLSAQAVGRLLTGAMSRQPTEELALAVHRATGGNPFLARELAASLTEGTAAVTDDAVAMLGPPGVQRSITARIAALDPAAGPVLRAVAVLGDRADTRHVAEVAQISPEAAVAVISQLVRAGLLADGLPTEFKHPVLRSTVHQEMTTVERQALHRRAAAALAATAASPAVIAAHLVLTEPEGAPATVETLRAAAREALAGGAAEAAVASLRRALAEPPSPEIRGDLLHALAAAEALVRDPASAEHLREAHALAADPVTRAARAGELAALLSYAGRWSEALDLIASALAELGDRDESMRVRLSALRVASSLDPGHVADFDRALPELLALSDSRRPEARALRLHLALAVAARGVRCELVPDLVARGLDGGTFIAEEGSDSLAAAQAVHALTYVDRLNWANAVAHGLTEDARDRGSVLGFAAGTGTRALVALRAGRLADVEDDARTATEIAQQHGILLILPFVSAYLVEALLERGAVSEAASVIDRIEVPAPFSEMAQGATVAETTARVRRAHGDRAGAASAWRRAGEILEGSGVHNPNFSSWRSELALAIAPDDHAQARTLVENELARARAAGSARALGIALRARGLVTGAGAIESGLADLVASTETLEPTGARLEYARSLTELGAALRRANRRSDARAPLMEARELAHGCGATALMERVSIELQAAGGRPRRIAIKGPAALTPSERRVAGLAAAGSSTPEIAQQLFVTVNTVETHLRGAYRKLDIHSRDELRRALSET